MMRNTTPAVCRDEGNIFAALELENPDELLAKAELALAFTRAIKERKLTQTALAKLTGIGQPKISRLMKGRIRGFSSDRLLHILTCLDQDVVILVAPRPAGEHKAARIRVEMRTTGV